MSSLYDFDKPKRTAPGGYTILQVMDQTFRIYRDNFGTILPLSAMIIIPVTIITAVVGGQVNTTPLTSAGGAQVSPELSLALCGGAIIALVGGIAQAIILNGSFTVMTSEWLFGSRTTLGELWALASPRFGKLLSAYVLFYVLMVGLGLVSVIMIALCPLLIVLLAVIMYVAITAGSFLAPVAVLEDNGGGSAVTRAHLLAKSRFWQVLGLSLLIGLVSVAISLVLSLILGTLFAGAARSAGAVVVGAIIDSVVAIVITPLLPIAMTQMYYDARARKENLSATLAEMGEDARAWDVRPPESSEPFLSSNDILNMVVVVGIVVVLSIVGGTVLAAFLNALVPGLGNFSGGAPI
jgi:hypothetical protein